MQSSPWQPPVETSGAEDKILKRIKRATLFIFLRRHRHQIFTPKFQVELADIYKDSPPGQPPVPPAMLGLAPILQVYTGRRDASWTQEPQRTGGRLQTPRDA
jgi:transposase